MTNSIELYNLIDKPDSFKGDPQLENPMLWLRNMETWMDALDLTEEQRLKVAPTFLKGAAATQYDKKMEKPETWAAFTARFKETFVPSDLEESWRRKLDSMKQDTLSVSALKLALEELFFRLDITNDSEKKRHLIKSLNWELAKWVERSRPTTYDEAISYARQEEIIMSKYGRTNHHGSLQNQDYREQQDPSPYSTPMDQEKQWYLPSRDNESITDTMDNLADALGKLKVHFTPRPTQAPARRYQVPQDYGQRYESGPSRNTPRGPFQPSRQQGNGWTCHNCGDPNHFVRNCPFPRQNRGDPYQQHQGPGKDQGQ